jgi:hypothetical protein
MPAPGPLSTLLRDNHEVILGAMLVVIAILCIMILWMSLRLGKLNRLYSRLTRGTSGGNLEEILQGYMNDVRNVSRRMDTLESELTRQGQVQLTCLQQVGLVRFDAFEEVGGEQSFAFAVLDAQRNGIVVSSVFSRTDVRVYAKAIRKGQSSHPLTREEQQAMQQAEGTRDR